ncbi:hypothetical protein [Epilithonimonas sp.]|uniref:hypothetical protein n=1 Tax=Epilithonimonas sp. TaxID=2894511 RepID=UPI0028A18261|nr:hypothetical protein [Epilithonimonas sp.]
MSVYSKLAENLQYISPTYYKSRFFKKLKDLTVQNILQRKVEPEFLSIKEVLTKDSVFMDVGANFAGCKKNNRKIQTNSNGRDRTASSSRESLDFDFRDCRLWLFRQLFG